MNIQQFLTENAVQYETLPHRTTFTASRLADALHEPGDYVAKSVVLKADGEYVLAVLPASHELELSLARTEMGCNHLELAHEEELGPLFPDCELGAMPPFGSLYGLRTWVDSRLTEDDHIVFDGQTHTEAVRMSYDSFAALEDPMVADLSHHL